MLKPNGQFIRRYAQLMGNIHKKKTIVNTRLFNNKAYQHRRLEFAFIRAFRYVFLTQHFSDRHVSIRRKNIPNIVAHNTRMQLSLSNKHL